ncbi:hypothetical protein LPJ53_001580 [Coemansia erecta]|uniref:Rab3-GAP regulatory subunit N-terminal domain-containing protein n=1 Tax=Coemansia erecta TaxID=147472 RepID=A0A9W7Y529_9FUNG|nr:hypothetical protein LPJ53_001580 [Coemansia erecta]
MSSSAVQQAATSKNGLLSVTPGGRIPPALLRLLFGDSNSTYNREFSDSEDGSSGATPKSSSSYGFSPPGLSFKKQLSRSLYALSADGCHLAVAYADRYMLLERPEDNRPSSNYRLVSVGSEVTSVGEMITAIYCLGVYAAQSSKQGKNHSLCVAVGYSTGYLRVFSLYGHILTTQQFHSEPLIRIRLRMPVQTGRAHNSNSIEDTEEVNLTYADGTVVSMDGKSLYLALRICLNENGATPDADGPMFQYKKWAFSLNMPLVSDAVSYGPATHRDPLASLANASLTSCPMASDATARFLVAPQHGDAAFGVFMTNEDAAMSYSAVDIAGKVAAKVTGAVLNIAKSYFWRTSPQPSSRESTGNTVTTDPGTIVPCAFAIHDPPRKVLDISLAPAAYALAALTDSLGRVMIFDLENCEVVHMLKGLRGSQCAWLEIDQQSTNNDNVSTGRRMFIVVYAGRRGTVEVFELGSLERPFASVSVGLGWRLVQCPTQPLGGSLVVGSPASTRRATLPILATCMLISENAQTAHIQINI